MKRKIIISDIHGCYDEFLKLLEKINFNSSNDELILLGDYIDRGMKSNQVIEKVMDLVENEDAIALGGNHEEMFINWLEDDYDEEEEMYFPQGGSATVFSYCESHSLVRNGDKARDIIREYYGKHIEFIKKLPDYYEDDNFIYVHAGLNPVLMNWKNSTKTDFRWSRRNFWNQKNETGKTIIFGHTPVSFFHEKKEPYFFPEKDRIAIDGGCVFGGFLHCLIIEGDYLQYQSVEKQ